MGAKILVLFFTKRGRLLTLANAVADGCRDAGGDVTVRRIPDVRNEPSDRFAEEVLAVPVVKPEDLCNYDAIIFGAPGRQGRISGEMSSFLDELAPLQTNVSLRGKLAGAFTSTGGVGRGYGGHEAILQSFHSTFLQHGMVVVGIPPSPTMDETSLASPFGCCMGGKAGSGARALSDSEATLAHEQGRYITELASKMQLADLATKLISNRN